MRHALFALALVACSTDPPPADAGPDAGDLGADLAADAPPEAASLDVPGDLADVPEAGPEAATDAGVDAGADAPVDVPVDTGTPLDTGPACVAPLVACAGRCVDITSDPDHCNECGRRCAAADPSRHLARYQCRVGVCDFACAAGYGNCDADPGNGCEVQFGNLRHCTACDQNCPRACALAPDGGRVCQ